MLQEILYRHLFAVDPTINWANPNGMEMPNPSSVPPFQAVILKLKVQFPSQYICTEEKFRRLLMETLKHGGLQMVYMELPTTLICPLTAIQQCLITPMNSKPQHFGIMTMQWELLVLTLCLDLLVSTF